MLRGIWKADFIDFKEKWNILQALVLSIFTYALETATLLERHYTLIDSFERRMYRVILKLPYTAHVHIPVPLSLRVKQRMLGWVGHIQRSCNSLTRAGMFPDIVNRRKGRARFTYIDAVSNTISYGFKLGKDEIVRYARVRGKWDEICNFVTCT